MKKVVFVNDKFQNKLHTLIASLNMDRDLVFEDGEVYFGAVGCEVNDYLMVRAEHKSRVLNLLGRALEGIG